jgi:hypothetical protein
MKSTNVFIYIYRRSNEIKRKRERIINEIRFFDESNIIKLNSTG